MKLGYSALALCDECSLSGIVRAHVAAKQRGLKLLIGSVSRAKGGASASGESRAAEFTEIKFRPSCSATCSHAPRLWAAQPSHQLRAEGSGEGGLLGRQADGRGQFTRGVLCAVVTSFGRCSRAPCLSGRLASSGFLARTCGWGYSCICRETTAVNCSG